MPVLSDSSEALPDVADRLRHVVLRLARLLRQQDDSGLGATAIAALVSVRKGGSLTLGELAASEQVAPPTMTKVVEKLEAYGFVTRHTDERDRRVSLVAITPTGLAHLDQTRQRRTAWLASALTQLDSDGFASVLDALGALEQLIGTDAVDTRTR